MELFFSIGYFIIGVLIVFVGFKRINPVHNQSKEKQAEFYRKWGLILKSGGIAIAAVGLLRLYYMF